MTGFECDLCGTPLDPNDESIYLTLTNFWLCDDCLAEQQEAMEQLEAEYVEHR